MRPNVRLGERNQRPPSDPLQTLCGERMLQVTGRPCRVAGGGGAAIIVPSDIIGEHVAAVSKYDWRAVERTVSENAQLRLAGVDSSVWTISNLYRYVTQAWDFTIDNVQISDGPDGLVRAQIRLTNGEWVKQIQGEYCVRENRIASITLTDAHPVKDGNV